MAEAVVSMHHITHIYEHRKVLDNVHFEIPRGSFMGLVGPNGGGKTTLIRILLGLLKPTEGSVELFNQPIHKFKQWNKVGFVSQKANTFNRGFPATAFEVVSMGLTAKIGYLRFFNNQHKTLVLDALDQVGMLEFAYENVGNLSGGQQQRIFIARSLVNDPELLILDEPTVGVDYENVKRFYDLLQQLNEEKNITLLLVTHDTGTMTEHATDIVCLNQTLHFHGKPEDYASLPPEELSKFYGHPVQVVTHDH